MANTLEEFISDLERITDGELAQSKIIEQAAPFL